MAADEAREMGSVVGMFNTQDSADGFGTTHTAPFIGSVWGDGDPLAGTESANGISGFYRIGSIYTENFETVSHA